MKESRNRSTEEENPSIKLQIKRLDICKALELRQPQLLQEQAVQKLGV